MKTSLLPLAIAMLAVVAHAAPVAPSHDIENHPRSVIPDDLQKRQTAKGSSVERVGTRTTDSLKRDGPPTPAEGAPEAAVKIKRGVKTLLAAGAAGGVILDRFVFQKIWPTLDMSSLPPDPYTTAPDPSTTASDKSTTASDKSTPPSDKSKAPSDKSAPPSDKSKPPSNQYPPPSNQYPPPSNQYPPPSNQYPPPSNQYAAPYNQYAAPYNQYAAPYNQYVPPSGHDAPPPRYPNQRSLSEEKDANIIRMKREQPERLVDSKWLANGAP